MERLIPLALRATQKSTLGNGVKVLPREQLRNSLPSSWVDETRPTLASEVMRSSAKCASLVDRWASSLQLRSYSTGHEANIATLFKTFASVSDDALNSFICLCPRSINSCITPTMLTMLTATHLYSKINDIVPP